MAYDPSNVFARILRGEIPAHKVYEDERTLAFMDVMPQADGHVLVVPKVAAENIYEVPGDALVATILTTQRIARAVRKAFDSSGVMVAQLNGRGAGQSVFHIHFHVIPRRDGVELALHARGMADSGVLAAHAERIRAALD